MKHLHNYPVYIPILRNILNLLLFCSGTYLLYNLNLYIALVYISYCLLAAIVLLPKLRCTVCAHFGTICSTGFGKVSSLFFNKNNKLPFKYGLWYNLFLLPIVIIPILGSLILIGNNNYFSYIYTLVIFYLALLLILLEHGYFGCLNCEELENCPANLVIKRLKKYVTN